MPLLPTVLLVVATAGCSDDEPTTSKPPASPQTSHSPSEAPEPAQTLEMTTFGGTGTASVSGCLTRSEDGYSYLFSLDVNSGEARYRVRMPHMDEWDDWSSWLGTNSFSSRSGASFGRDPESLQGAARAQVEVREGERSSFSTPLGALTACPEA